MRPQEFLLSACRAMLETALASGYRFVGYEDIGKETTPLTCLLRHDVDSELYSLEPMMQLEHSLGIRATYFLMTRSTAYNVFSVEGARVVGRLAEHGHRIGLHFMGEQCEQDSTAALAGRIRHEADWL